MSTSGTTSQTRTVRDVIKHALRQLGELAAMQEPKAADEQMGVEMFSDMLKDWQNDGVNLWRMPDYEVTWPAATAEGEITGLADIIDLRYQVSDTYERPLARWELGDYATLPNKAQVGPPNIFCISPSPTAGSANVRIRLWPVPADEVTLFATGNRIIQDVTDPNETADVPPQYIRTAIMCLAAYMAPSFNKEMEKGQLIEESKRLYRIMRAADRPASYFMNGTQRYG